MYVTIVVSVLLYHDFIFLKRNTIYIYMYIYYMRNTIV